jgi:hypothetical protein
VQAILRLQDYSQCNTYLDTRKITGSTTQHTRLMMVRVSESENSTPTATPNARQVVATKLDSVGNAGLKKKAM